MSRLVLIKHSLPEISAHRPAAEWPLSPEGIRRCAVLAERLAPFGIERLFASSETKALRTARLVGERLGLFPRIVEGLEEQHRRTVRLLPQEDYESAVRNFFARPDELVFGEETASRAERRFAGAVSSVLSSHPGENVAIVSHGTVISLFVASRCGVDGFDLWRRLRLPSFAVLDLPDFLLEEIVHRIG